MAGRSDAYNGRQGKKWLAHRNDSWEAIGIGPTYLASKIVFAGFMAAWFFAASPMRRSLSVKETKEGVVKLPCSLAMISTFVPS